MHKGLEYVAETQAACIAAYEAETGVTPIALKDPVLPDFEAATDAIHGRLASEHEQEQKNVPKFLSTLGSAYAGSNIGRILQIAREDRGVVAMIAPQSNETPGPLRIIAPNSTAETPLLTWDDMDLAIVNGDHLAALWRDGVRDVEFEISTNLRNGRRPFRLLRLLTDGSIWPIPPAFLDRFTSKALRDMCC